MKRALFFAMVGALLLVAGLSVPGATPGLAQGPTPTTTPPPPITDPHGTRPMFLGQYYDLWVKSPHAAKDTEPFKHWDAEMKVAGACSVCHSTPGYVEFLTTGKTPVDQPIGSVVNCDACHNPIATELKTVKFPSGVEVGDMGDATRCMVCHQGRSSTVQVNAKIEKAVGTELDKPSKDLTFTNIHYFAAAASIYGSEAHGGYEYTGKVYQMRFRHVEGYDTCVGCHNPHTLEVKLTECATCHEDVKTVEDLKNIRMQGSLSDYDGDGNIVEGVAAEIEGLQTILYTTIRTYAEKVAGKPIGYNKDANPYFFVDDNNNGTIEAEEKTRYDAFTGRLEQATYNYQVSMKDPGKFAHNAAYHIELLYDSIESLNSALGTGGIDMSSLTRNDPGHFDTTGEPFRHWDEEGVVPGTCAKCHTATGLPTFLANNANIGVKPSNSLACTTCHDDIPKFTVRPVAKVTFPSGSVVSFGEKEKDNICLSCHQGRESTVSVDRAITTAKVGPDEVTDKLSFRNIHYFVAGVTIFGNDAKGAYQFEGKEYNGRFIMDDKVETCTDCHDTHSLKIDEDKCLDCHEDADTYKDIRNEKTLDYDGDGDTTEGLLAEIEAYQEELLKAAQAYAAKTTGDSIAYSSAAYPYWFIDTNKNGTVDPDEAKSENSFKKWTPNLLRAAYNYQYAQKDPGKFAHNGQYVLQILFDSIEAVGGKDAVAKFTRPPLAAAK